MVMEIRSCVSRTAPSLGPTEHLFSSGLASSYDVNCYIGERQIDHESGNVNCHLYVYMKRERLIQRVSQPPRLHCC